MSAIHRKRRYPHIRSLHVEERSDALIIDASTRRNLELDVESLGKGRRDRIRARRQMRHRHGLARVAPLAESAVDGPGPCCDPGTRHWAPDRRRRFEGLREHLHGIGDIERILSRVALRSARPRDLTQLRTSLALLPALRDTLATD
jgi:DNA mismatch repair protein MutS